jgi:hypothetical protein
MYRMRQDLRRLSMPALLAQDRRAKPKPVMRPPAMKARPMPHLPGKCRARLMLMRMRPMVRSLKRPAKWKG